jgi:hypothetical protein
MTNYYILWTRHTPVSWRLMRYVILLAVTKQTLDGMVSYKKHSICGAKIGCYCCRKRDRESEFAHYGPGVVIYF